MSLLLKNPTEDGFFSLLSCEILHRHACLLGTVVSLMALFHTDVKSQTNWDWEAPLDIIRSSSLLVSHFFAYSIPFRVIRCLTEFAYLCRVM